jgi:hypothetical protein
MIKSPPQLSSQVHWALAAGDLLPLDIWSRIDVKRLQNLERQPERRRLRIHWVVLRQKHIPWPTAVRNPRSHLAAHRLHLNHGPAPKTSGNLDRYNVQFSVPTGPSGLRLSVQLIDHDIDN